MALMDAGRRYLVGLSRRLRRSIAGAIAAGFGRYSRRYAVRTRVNQEELGELTALAEETIAGIRVVKGLGAGAALSARFRRRSDRVVGTALAVADVDAVFLPALEALPLIGI